jgi:hypothetical protein
MPTSWTTTLKRFYRRKRSGPPVVVVSGLPRSGTSMAMNMLKAGGIKLHVDEMRQADIDNPKGYFEFEQVKNLANETNKGWVLETRGKAVKVISHLLRDLPQSCYYQVIFMNRSLDEIIASQNKMLQRLGGPISDDSEKIKENFARHLHVVKSWLKKQSNVELLELNYADVLKKPQDSAERIRSFLGLDLQVNKMVEAIDPLLYRNRAR